MTFMILPVLVGLSAWAVSAVAGAACAATAGSVVGALKLRDRKRGKALIRAYEVGGEKAFYKAAEEVWGRKVTDKEREALGPMLKELRRAELAARDVASI